MCIVYVHVCGIQIFSVLQKGGGGWLALYCMNMYDAYGEILTTLFTGLGYARLVSEHTYITYD